MKELLIATGNPGKFMEIYEILKDLPLKFLSLSDVSLSSDVDETGETHAENALLKARHFYRKIKMPTLAEDSGIIVDVLSGELGLHTRRWGPGHSASDEEWIEAFLARMKDVPEDERQAHFVCHAALILGKGEEHLFEGQCQGMITSDLEAPIKEGLPLSSCFKPHGFDKVYAALKPEEKAEISHRGLAISHVRDFLTHVISLKNE